jgi:hypothetical protein
MVSFINKKGDRVVIPFVMVNGEWKPVGSYLVYGTSRSDPKYGAVFALPHNWKPTSRILREIERTK